MVLLLHNHEIRGLMDIPEYIDAVEAGYREYGNGNGAAFPRKSLWIKGESSDTYGGHMPPGSKASFKLKAGLLPGLRGAGLNAYTAGLPDGLETYMFLFDAESGALAAIMEVMYLSWLKTAAVSALATRFLAPPGSSVLALFGSGRHARSQLYGISNIATLQRVQVYSRNAEKRNAFCARMSAELGTEVVPVNSPAEALRDADIVTAITTSPDPVFAGVDLPDKPLHINGLGAHYPWVREIDTHTVVNSRVFVDVYEQGISENGEIVIPMQAGLIDDSHVVGDLGALAVAAVRARLPDTKWTLFLSGGTGVDDIAVAMHLYKRALERGIGTIFEFNLPYQFEI
ncbi:MAG: ornithine cyclodeaminase family protein [Chloroflexota bacterium]|nr:ornithine cyclodeaminase family protein [Chloroflexota bacterium]MDE2853485.1 ornithine cyclodeaminase family protein [Chloroflexota bacterium]MDE2945475.1 ornithine cyclodeaminase family protein [Chloroflexota bacterium]